MLYLEKLYISDNQCPGLVETFAKTSKINTYQGFLIRNTTEYFGQLLTEKLADYNIHLGKQFGSQGVSIDQLMSGVKYFSDTIFEISALSYQEITPLQRQFLDKNTKCIVHDYSEGGYTLSKVQSDHLTATGSIQSDSTVNIPMFAYYTVAETARTGNLKSINFAHHPEKLCLIPIHKPRPDRIELLQTLDDMNMLNQCDWSLTVNLDQDGDMGSYEKSPNVGKNRWTYLPDNEFIKKYAHILPKKLDDIQLYSDCVPLLSKYHRQYKWYISCETYYDYFFVTEKTWKAFLSGLPVLTLAPAGFNAELEKLGFIMPGDYDHLEHTERIQAIIEMLKHDFTDIAEHNYKLVTDKNFFCDLIVNQLRKLL